MYHSVCCSLQWFGIPSHFRYARKLVRALYLIQHDRYAFKRTGIITTLSHDDCPLKTPEVFLMRGDYYIDGPVFLKSGVRLRGRRSEDGDSIDTWFHLHGSGTGADGMITIDGVSGALVSIRAHAWSFRLHTR